MGAFCIQILIYRSLFREKVTKKLFIGLRGNSNKICINSVGVDVLDDPLQRQTNFLTPL